MNYNIFIIILYLTAGSYPVVNIFKMMLCLTTGGYPVVNVYIKMLYLAAGGYPVGHGEGGQPQRYTQDHQQLDGGGLLPEPWQALVPDAEQLLLAVGMGYELQDKAQGVCQRACLRLYVCVYLSGCECLIVCMCVMGCANEYVCVCVCVWVCVCGCVCNPWCQCQQL